ncbi:hypothetical protein EJ110_NYTH41350 [Nymphaea thermarum]|nr:hypothetical protein EJ110_NYTH41350 [Nymphaea thermarum]
MGQLHSVWLWRQELLRWVSGISHAFKTQAGVIRSLNFVRKKICRDIPTDCQTAQFEMVQWVPEHIHIFLVQRIIY